MKLLTVCVCVLATILLARGHEIGEEAKDRPNLDEWSNAMYIPEPEKTIGQSGRVLSWKFYAKRKAHVYMQIWRKHNGNIYTLVGQEFYDAKSVGVHVVSASTDGNILAMKGDVVGFYFPSQSLIPFDGKECYSGRGLYVEAPRGSTVAAGKQFTFKEMQSGWRPCRHYSLSVTIGTAATHEFGHQTHDRQYLDEWTNAIYIPDPKHKLPHGGIVEGWRLYARRAGEIYLQVWHPTSGSEYELVGQTEYQVPSAGVHEAPAAIDIKDGDVLGFYFPGKSIIPFDGRECSNERGLYVKNPLKHLVKIGGKFRFSTKQTGWNPCRKYALAAIVLEATLSGNSIEDRDNIDEWSNAMYIPEPDKPITSTGTIYGWRYYARRSADIYLQVFRPVPGYRKYKLIAQTKTKAEGQGTHHLTLVTPVQVEKGDVIGFFFPGQSTIPFDGKECSLGRGLYVKSPTGITIGATFSFSQKQTGWKPCRKYSFGALMAASTGKDRRSVDENTQTGDIFSHISNLYKRLLDV